MCLYKEEEGSCCCLFALYIDDILVVGASKLEVHKVKDDLGAAFDIKDLGRAKWILGMNIVEIEQRRRFG